MLNNHFWSPECSTWRFHFSAKILALFSKVDIILFLIRVLPKYLLGCINWRGKEVKVLVFFFPSLFLVWPCSSGTEFIEIIPGTQCLWHDPPSLESRMIGVGVGVWGKCWPRQIQKGRVPVPWCQSCTKFQWALFSTGNEMMECLKSRTGLGKWHDFFFLIGVNCWVVSPARWIGKSC